MTEAISITELEDPRVAGYRNMRERDLRAEGLFITEGALLAERLLASRFVVQSLLVSADSEARFAALHGRAPLYVAPAALLRRITGFDFHRGVLGLGRRASFPDAAALVPSLLARMEGPAARLRLIACPATETAENLGLILRSAAAFGVHGVLLPAAGADPLSRRCLRQSMGAALALPLAESSDLPAQLRALRDSHGLQLIAAFADEGPHVVALESFAPPERSVLVVGNEFRGLDAEWLALCDHHVTIPITPGCDSLNVAVATGIFLHHLRI